MTAADMPEHWRRVARFNPAKHRKRPEWAVLDAGIVEWVLAKKK